jgi:hypothetical protein
MNRSATECPGNTIGKPHPTISFGSKFTAINLDSPVFFSFLRAERKADVNFQSVLGKAYLKYRKFIGSLLQRARRQVLTKSELNHSLAAPVLTACNERSPSMGPEP